MAIQKKSLIGNLSATKKAIVAKGAASEVGTVKSEAAPVALNRRYGITLKKAASHGEGMTLSRKDGFTLSRKDGMTLSRKDGFTLSRKDGMTLSRRDGITLKK